MSRHLLAGVHYYRACSGTDSWPRDTLSLVGAVHCVQVSGSHQIQFCRKGMPPVSLILPEHHHVVLPPSLHNRVSIAATGLTRASLLVLAATYQPDICENGSGAYPAPFLRPWPASCTSTPPPPTPPRTVPLLPTARHPARTS